MVKILGVEFVPLRVPLERRIQTLCMGQYVMSFLFGGFGCLFLSIYLLFTRFYWISLLYAGWYLLDRKTSETGGNPSSWIRYNVVWRKMGEYFPAKLHKTADLDPRKSYVFGLHPHGIMHISGFLAFATEATGFSELFPGLFPTWPFYTGSSSSPSTGTTS